MHLATPTAPTYGRTFPLYVPPIDWFFLTDDRPRYTMSFFLDLDFSGQLDRSLFEAAVDEAVQRHPLLFCRVGVEKNDRLCWVLAPELRSPVDWADDSVPIDMGDGYLDLRETTGLRIWVRQSAAGARVSMQFHHAACDGTGAYRFVGDLLGCYMRRLPSCQGDVELSNFDAASLKVRRSKMRSILMHESALKKFRLAASEAFNHIGTRVAPLKPPAKRPETFSLPAMQKQTFSAAQLASLRKAATSQGGTLNDLFLSKMFVAARRWNGSFSGSRKIRLLVPADMRDGDDFEIPACNMTACTFITRSLGEIEDEKRLMELIVKDTLALKNGQPQKDFVNSITTAMEGGLLPWILKASRCLATGVFSNAGDPSRRFTGRLPKRRGKVSCDDFTLEAITGVPPLREQTRSTLSSSIYGRQLTFSLRCDPYLFGPDDTKDLLELFCDQLRPLV
ncbi:hypothetical protein [Roseiconus lacunae]|uniref:hypothetical protein n=1 Tax=Roseiconus lacunae TaxID=2605694 RepID=UPI0011F23B2B|nr:hypothetical protein [Roseiconus lacunae]MCD0463114.1 hypothetical protein [Roseiconus lacunae]WRQ53144.1 hypothetical protein U8335_11585 [Stieleria sp. HD01]